jgi:putative ABC transport system permease protein
VIGVLSERSQRLGLPADVLSPRVADLPIEPDPRDPRSVRQFWPATARLRQGITMKQAQAELDVIAASLAENYPNTNKGYGISAERLGPPSVAPIIRVLFAAACCVLVIACANVASLLLVRASGRQREMSVRAALGASRGRLIRQLLTENMLVALLGGAAGILVAHWALDFIRTTAAAAAFSGAARFAHLELDGGVLAFALGLSIATAFVFGLAPALLSSPVDLNGALRQGTRGSTEGRSRGRFRATLVVIEIAAAITLLACGGLLIRSFLRMAAYEPGFDPKHTAFVRLTMKGSNYAKADQLNAFANAVVARVQSVPGVKASGTTSYFPLSGRS